MLGIIAASAGGGLVNTVTSVSAKSGSSSSLVLSGSASSGNLYIICHGAFNPDSSPSIPTFPTNYTSLSSYQYTRFSFRMSYRVLPTNLASITLPSVSNATDQFAIGYQVSRQFGSFNGATLSNEVGYQNIANAMPGPFFQASGTLPININDILIGYVMFSPADPYNNTSFGSPSVTVQQTNYPSYQTAPSIFSTAKCFTPDSLSGNSWSISGTSNTIANQIGYNNGISNTFRITPTFV